MRRAVLTRDNWRCQTCGKYGNEVDHVLSLRRGGAAYALENLQVLCRGCHIGKTQSENRRKPTPAEAAWADMVRELQPDA